MEGRNNKKIRDKIKTLSPCGWNWLAVCRLQVCVHWAHNKQNKTDWPLLQKTFLLPAMKLYSWFIHHSSVHLHPFIICPSVHSTHLSLIIHHASIHHLSSINHPSSIHPSIHHPSICSPIHLLIQWIFIKTSCVPETLLGNMAINKKDKVPNYLLDRVPLRFPESDMSQTQLLFFCFFFNFC